MSDIVSRIDEALGASPVAPEVTAEIALVDQTVNAFGALSVEVLDFAGEIVGQLSERFPDLTDSGRFRVAAYQMHVMYDLATISEHPSAYKTAAGYMVAAWRLAAPLRRG